MTVRLQLCKFLQPRWDAALTTELGFVLFLQQSQGLAAAAIASQIRVHIRLTFALGNTRCAAVSQEELCRSTMEATL